MGAHGSSWASAFCSSPLLLTTPEQERYIQRELPDHVEWREAQVAEGDGFSPVACPAERDPQNDEGKRDPRNPNWKGWTAQKGQHSGDPQNENQEPHEQSDRGHDDVGAHSDETKPTTPNSLADEPGPLREQRRDVPVLPASPLLDCGLPADRELASGARFDAEQRLVSEQGELNAHREVFDDIGAKLGGGARYLPGKGHPSAREMTRLPQAPEAARSHPIAHQRCEG